MIFAVSHFAASDILAFGVLAAAVAAAVLFAFPWSRGRGRPLIGALTTFAGWCAWNFTIDGVGVVPKLDVDAPIIGLSWADAGSGIFALVVTALVFGLITDRNAPARSAVGAAAVAGLAALIVDLFVL